MRQALIIYKYPYMAVESVEILTFGRFGDILPESTIPLAAVIGRQLIVFPAGENAENAKYMQAFMREGRKVDYIDKGIILYERLVGGTAELVTCSLTAPTQGVMRACGLRCPLQDGSYMAFVEPSEDFTEVDMLYHMLTKPDPTTPATTA